VKEFKKFGSAWSPKYPGPGIGGMPMLSPLANEDAEVVLSKIMTASVTNIFFTEIPLKVHTDLCT
jgi:hypothetical protein